MAAPRARAGTLQLPFPTAEMWRKRIAEFAADDYLLVAEVDGEVVANLGLHSAGKSPRRRHVGHLGMAVRDDWQQRGVGSALMTAALDLADRWLNYRRLELTVYTDNVGRARALSQVRLRHRRHAPRLRVSRRPLRRRVRDGAAERSAGRRNGCGGAARGRARPRPRCAKRRRRRENARSPGETKAAADAVVATGRMRQGECTNRVQVSNAASEATIGCEYERGDAMAMRVGIVGWRGMVGSVLMQRMLEERDFDHIEPTFFSTSAAGGKAPDIGRDVGALQGRERCRGARRARHDRHLPGRRLDDGDVSEAARGRLERLLHRCGEDAAHAGRRGDHPRPGESCR